MRNVTGHKISFFAYVDGERTRRTSTMPNSAFGWDATCGCGWDSKTGGAVMAEVDRMVAAHKLDAVTPGPSAEDIAAAMDMLKKELEQTLPVILADEPSPAAEAYEGLTAKGKALMAQIGTWRGSFFDDGIVEHSGAFGEVLAGELDLALIGVKSVKGVAGVLNGTAKAGLWTVIPKEQGEDSDYWMLTALGADVAHYAAKQ